MFTTLFAIGAVVLTAGCVLMSLWHTFKPNQSVTQILAELETPTKR